MGNSFTVSNDRPDTTQIAPEASGKQEEHEEVKSPVEDEDYEEKQPEQQSPVEIQGGDDSGSSDDDDNDGPDKSAMLILTGALHDFPQFIGNFQLALNKYGR